MKHEKVLTLTDTVSFSFTMGTTPMDSNSLNVLTAFRYRVLCAVKPQYTKSSPSNS